VRHFTLRVWPFIIHDSNADVCVLFFFFFFFFFWWGVFFFFIFFFFVGVCVFFFFFFFVVLCLFFFFFFFYLFQRAGFIVCNNFFANIPFILFLFNMLHDITTYSDCYFACVEANWPH